MKTSKVSSLLIVALSLTVILTPSIAVALALIAMIAFDAYSEHLSSKVQPDYVQLFEERLSKLVSENDRKFELIGNKYNEIKEDFTKKIIPEINKPKKDNFLF